MSEKEEDSPTANDCTTLTLVDAVPSQSTSLLAENQDCGVEPRNCHEGTDSAASVAKNEKSLNSAIADQLQGQVEAGNLVSLMAENQDCGVEAMFPHEGTCSAPSVAQDEKSSTSAIANQTQGLVEHGNSASLLVENSVSGVEIKADHEGEGSAALVTEKWSHEAIVARSNMRPVRREKLNRAANSGENPGFDFLQECWNDDPALRIVIKKLLAKCSQWGLVAADGMLVKWEG